MQASTPSTISSDDAARKSSLRRMKLVATSLFVIAAAVFIASLQFGSEGSTFWGYVEAASEAAMVGAIADWFAVTALFKHPLGLPIPHTAIIKKRKDQIGSSLGSFVRDNFLTRQVIESRLNNSNLAAGLGLWMAKPTNSTIVVKQSSALISGAVEILEDDKVQATIEEAIRNKVEAMPAADMAGRMLDGVVEGDHHQTVFDSVLKGLSGFLEDNADVFRQKFSAESPWWIPDLVDDRVYNKVYGAVRDFINEINLDKSHPLRADFDSKIRELRVSLETSPELQASAEEWKNQIVNHDEVSTWISSIWGRSKQSLIAGVGQPDSAISLAISDAVQGTGKNLTNDKELQAKVNSWLTDAAVYVAEEFRDQVSGLIQSTVETWDADETAERLELQVGRDLQFIRINGTIVGGLAGLVIHAVAELF